MNQAYLDVKPGGLAVGRHQEQEQKREQEHAQGRDLPMPLRWEGRKRNGCLDELHMYHMYNLILT